MRGKAKHPPWGFEVSLHPIQTADICFLLPRSTIFFKVQILVGFFNVQNDHFSGGSICILNANCEVLISVPSLCTSKGSISSSIFPVMAEFSTSFSVRSHHPPSHLFPPPPSVYSALLCLSAALFSLSHPSLSFLPPLSRSYRCIALVDPAVCFGPRVDEEGALGCGVDLFPALILVGVAVGRLSGPARNDRIVSLLVNFPDLFLISWSTMWTTRDAENTTEKRLSTQHFVYCIH